MGSVAAVGGRLGPVRFHDAVRDDALPLSAMRVDDETGAGNDVSD